MLNVQSTRRSPPSTRSDAEQRRLQLVEVTIAAMADVGFEGATLSEIAGRAGVSPGLVAHHFESKDGLLAAAFRSLVGKVGAAMLAGLRTSRTPRERLRAVIDAHLGDQDFDERAGAAWLAFWGHVPHDARLRRLQRVYQRRMLSNLADALARVGGGRGKATPLAGMIAAMIDGVWLRAALSGWTEADGASARRRLTQFVESQVRLLEVEGTQEPSGDPVAGAADRPVAISTGAATDDEVERAIHATRAAQPAWAALSDAKRRAVFLKAAVLIGGASGSLARLEAQETGTALEWTTAAVSAAASWLERMAGAPAEAPKTPPHPSGLQRVWSEPEGAVVAPLSGRSPFLGVCLQVAEALMDGAGVVALAAPGALGSPLRLVELLQRAGAPDGLLQVLEDGREKSPFVDRLPQVVLPPCAPIIVVLADGDVDKACAAIAAPRLPDEVRPPVILAQRQIAPRLLGRLARGVGVESRPFDSPIATRVRDLDLGTERADGPIDAPRPATTVIAFDGADDLLLTVRRAGPLKRAILYGRDLSKACDMAGALPVATCVINPPGPLDPAVIETIPGAPTALRWRRQVVCDAGRGAMWSAP